MRLHVIAGSRDLLLPCHMAPESIERLAGDRIRVAKAGWISGRCGERYHGFLQDEPLDARTRIMGQALREEYGKRFEPLIVLPHLLDEAAPHGSSATGGSDPERRSQQTVLGEIIDSGNITHLRVMAVALPATVDPEGAWAARAGITASAAKERLGRLEATGLTPGVEKLDTEVLRLDPGSPAFEEAYTNALCQYSVSKLSPQLSDAGWETERQKLAAACSRRLLAWNDDGLIPKPHLHHDQLDGITDALLNTLLS